MGRKIRTSSDPSRDKSHPKGSVVEFIQPAYGEHGNIHVKYYRQSLLYWKRANELYKNLFEMHQSIYEIEPDDSGFRNLIDKKHEDVMYEYFVTGSNFIQTTWLCFQHFTNEALGHWFLHPDNPPESLNQYEDMNSKDLAQKLTFIHKEILKDKSLQKHKGYDALVGKFEQMRNNINHPKNSNSYNATDEGWDTVPLAWLLSGKFKQQFEEIMLYAERLFEYWYIKEKEIQRPGKINIKQRGIVSNRKPNLLRNRHK